jgi:hypothetical protein
MYTFEQEGQESTPEAELFKAAVSQAVRQYKFKSFSFKSSKRNPEEEEDDGGGKRQKTSSNINKDGGGFILELVVRHVLTIKQRGKVQVMQ